MNKRFRNAAELAQILADAHQPPENGEYDVSTVRSTHWSQATFWVSDGEKEFSVVVRRAGSKSDSDARADTR